MLDFVPRLITGAQPLDPTWGPWTPLGDGNPQISFYVQYNFQIILGPASQIRKK